MADVCVIDWHVHPFRTARWEEAWAPAAERALAFGASSYSLTRSEDDPLHYRQTSVWERREDFERYWFSEELTEARERIMNLYNKPLLPNWYTLFASSDRAASAAPAGPS